eukprot:gnl/Chilomastix_caulleri/2271.p1 GENE.gnl/Chilomastix_caulleri/2271~~gnl/Chilomastix_caulleri/2271.p1  ORF type:complete len:171 (+),score=48.28 gnl/Chilomastix_caulleri/2271:24-515(+)
MHKHIKTPDPTSYSMVRGLVSSPLPPNATGHISESVFPIHNEMTQQPQPQPQQLTLADIGVESCRMMDRPNSLCGIRVHYSSHDLDRIEATLDAVIPSPSLVLSGANGVGYSFGASHSFHTPSLRTKRTLSPEYRAIVDNHKRLVAQSPIIGVSGTGWTRSDL